MSGTFVYRAHRCKKPTSQRYKLNAGDVWRCNACGQHWKWIAGLSNAWIRTEWPEREVEGS